ncbi:MAG: signal peptidase I [Clostridia bacterium]|nr:signal peptidase I [Clostridia bacterium]MBO5785878.1 signal peptidase I [Clostridia bacterium]
MNVEEITLPTPEQIEEEIARTKYRKRYRRVLRSTIYTLVTVAAIAVLVATIFLPVLQVYGGSMTPTLSDGDIVLTLKTSEFETGDVIAFYYNNKILIKRVIASAGDWVDITPEGDVYVNGELLDEPYLDEKAFGDCDIELPYQVPESRVFVMGDHRSISVDSRNTAVGCVSEEQIVGKLVFRVWPMEAFGEIN